MKAYPSYKKTEVVGIGDIPDHWNVLLFKRLYSAIKDGTHGTFERISEGQPLLSAKNVFPDGIRTDEAESLISEKDYKEIISNGFPKKNDLLLTIVGTIGRALVYDLDEPLAFQRSVLFIRLRENLNPRFYCYVLQSAFFQHQLIRPYP